MRRPTFVLALALVACGGAPPEPDPLALPSHTDVVEALRSSALPLAELHSSCARLAVPGSIDTLGELMRALPERSTSQNTECTPGVVNGGWRCVSDFVRNAADDEFAVRIEAEIDGLMDVVPSSVRCDFAG